MIIRVIWVVCDMTNDYSIYMSHMWYDQRLFELYESYVIWPTNIRVIWVICDMTNDYSSYMSRMRYDQWLFELYKSHVIWRLFELHGSYYVLWLMTIWTARSIWTLAWSAIRKIGFIFNVKFSIRDFTCLLLTMLWLNWDVSFSMLVCMYYMNFYFWCLL